MASRWQLTIVTLCVILPTPLAQADTFGSGSNTFDIDFVTIGDPGNPADANVNGKPSLAGAVDYTYRIAQYEISRGMVNDANAEGNLGIEMFDMSDFGGNGSSQPATHINWLEAATFANWLNTSSGFPPAYNLNGEDFSLWSPGSPGYDANNRYRNSLAHYFLPSSDEWYKAAYYDPSKNEGDTDYWIYPTGSDEPPTIVASGTGSGKAVYFQDFETGPARITQAGGLSPYGVMGLGGNVTEWIETEQDLVNDNSMQRRLQRGGSWGDDEFPLSVEWLDNGSLKQTDIQFGFRVAAKYVPPSVPGDFNEDGVLDAADINDLTLQSAGGTHPEEYDLNDDALVNQGDVQVWVKDLFESWIGDANLNHEFNSSDMVQVFTFGKYESGAQAVWTEGDWNGDGFFTSSDMVAAFSDGGYEKGPPAVASMVPEPTSVILLLTGLMATAIHRRRLRP